MQGGTSGGQTSCFHRAYQIRLWNVHAMWQASLRCRNWILAYTGSSSGVLPWLQRPVEKNNYPWKPKWTASRTGLWSLEPRNSYWERICPSSLIGSSNETTIVIGLRKVWFPRRQHSTKMRLSIRATRGYFFSSWRFAPRGCVISLLQTKNITSGTQGSGALAI